MAGVISTKEAMRLMRGVGSDGKPVLFDLQFVKADRRRREKGSDIVELQNVMIRGMRRQTVAKAHFEKLDELKNKKDPHHDVNKTVNVYEPARDRMTKVHVRLITGFNNTRVVY